MNESDLDLLARYVQQRDERAFAQLVRRHVDWIYSMARRRMGSAHAAEDVTQAVFLALCQQADKLARQRTSMPLTPWLFKVTRRLSAKSLVLEARRTRIEQGAMAHRQQTERGRTDDEQWQQIAPMLDEMVGSLPAADRTAIVLRFYQCKSWLDIGRSLGLSEDAARKRASRALEKLRLRLRSKRLATGSAVGLATVLFASTTSPAPAGLTSVIVSNGMLPAAASPSVAALAKGAIGMCVSSKAKAVAALIAFIILAGSSGVGLTIVSNTVNAEPSATTQPVDAASLVRAVRDSESWIDRVQSFQVRLENKWIRSPESIAAKRSELEGFGVPAEKMTPELYGDLAPESSDTYVLAFDAKRLYWRRFQTEKHFDVRFWDGHRGVAYELYPSGQEHYAYLRGYARIGDLLLSNMSWPRAGGHELWFLPEHERVATGWHGNPEDFKLAGREKFDDIDCYRLEGELPWIDVYVGVADHRLYGLTLRYLAASRDQIDAASRDIRAKLGNPVENYQALEKWWFALPPEKHRHVNLEYHRALRPFSRPLTTHHYADYREIAPGRLLPMKQWYEIEGKRREMSVVDVKIDQPLPQEWFDMEFEEGVQVHDWAHDPPLHYKHKTNFSKEEWQAILDEGKRNQEVIDRARELDPDHPYGHVPGKD